jgi:NTP pyrophosphatase (non-canonical NTP hydrolase)
LNLKEFQIEVQHLADAKGYNQDLHYLFSRLVQEGSELIDAIQLEKSDEEVGEEGADVLHFFFQIINKKPNVNIDSSLSKKIASNYINKKKTWENGKMVKK